VPRPRPSRLRLAPHLRRRATGKLPSGSIRPPHPPAVIPAKAGTHPEMKRFNSLQLDSAPWSKIEKSRPTCPSYPPRKNLLHTPPIPAIHAVPTKRRAGRWAARGRLGGCVDADHRPGEVKEERGRRPASTSPSPPQKGAARGVRKKSRSCEAAFASSFYSPFGVKAASHRATATP